MEKIIERIVNDEINKLIRESELISERFRRPTGGIVTFGAGAVSKKKKYASKLWDLIQTNYRDIGGCRSFEDMNGDGGFNDFLNGKYVWNVYFTDYGEPIGINVYRPTRLGRKLICTACGNRNVFNLLMNNDFKKGNHTYGEVSGKPEHILRKNPNVPWISNDHVQRIFDDEGGWKRTVSTKQNPEIDAEERVEYDPTTHYYRNIGNRMFRKRMYGHIIQPKGSPNYHLPMTNRYANA